MFYVLFDGQGDCMPSLVVCFAVGLLGIFFVIQSTLEIYRMPSAPAITKIGLIIQKGAFAFLKRQYSLIIPFILFVSLVTLFLYGTGFVFFYLLGATFSLLSGFIGMVIATNANYKTTEAAKTSINKALYVAFSGGSGMGMITCALGIIGISIAGLVSLLWTKTPPSSYIIGFSLGASTVALFARVGGGIYTKAADVGADLVGKTEAKIPEDDPRNPAVIADNVGDNVGDVAGMGADLFESYVGAIYGCIALIGILFPDKLDLYFSFIQYLICIGFISSLIVILLCKILSSNKNLQPKHLIKNLGWITSVISIVGIYFLCRVLLQEFTLFLAVSTGIICGSLIGFITDYYTSAKPVMKIAQNSISGTATNLLSGFSFGMESTGLTIIMISISIWLMFRLGGIFAIALGGLGMLITLASTVSVDAYGPISDNARGIAELTKQPSYVRERTDVLDSIGNTTAAIGKGFSIGSAALTSLTLFNTFASLQKVKASSVSFQLNNPNIMIGLLIGGMLPFLFTAVTINEVTKTADLMVKEVRRQFKTIVGLLEGSGEADYAKCIGIAATGAIKGILVPTLIGILPPFILYFTVGLEGIAGLLAGSLLSGVMLAIFMSNAGGAWDNAKKLIETGMYGGKGSMTHIAAVTGDTVGDPLKDTAGPSLNILIKLIAIVSLTFIPALLP